MTRYLTSVLLVIFAPSMVGAQNRTVTLDAPVERTLGDPIAVILTVTAAATDDAAVPTQPLEPFEIVGKDVSIETSKDRASKTFTFTLELLCFEIGEHELGPIQVRITTEGGELVELESNAATVEVLSVLANEPDPQLKPPTSPVVVEQDDYRLLFVLGALLAVALGALLAWLLMRWWRKRDRPVPAPPPPPPPWETALAELRELRRARAAAIAEGQTEQWVDAVSDSIRAYLGRRFGFHGLESTTDEIAERLRRAKSLGIAPSDAVAFLGECDLVKFARASLADEASQALIEDAFMLVDRTRPNTDMRQERAA